MGDAPSIYENGIYRVGDVRLSDLSGRKRLPIGNSTFITTVQNSVFIDKSMLIADVLDGPFTATLFCRPRRFGKSLNLSMLHRFLEIPSPSDPAAMDTTPLFSGLAIWGVEEGYYRQHHGAYPVIRFSFNDTKGLEWETSYGMIAANIAAEYGRHRYVLEGDVPENERATFERILSQSASEAEVRSSLVLLSHMLFRHHGARVVILIDEYDAPVMAGYTYDYYTEVVDFLKGWLTGALKDNEALAFACLTGVQRISKESIFSDLNNLGVNTALNVVSDERYGFTDAEVAALAQYLGRGDAMAEARRWYDGYRFGGLEIYCPWDVMNHVERLMLDPKAQPVGYWKNSSDNAIIRLFIDLAGDTVTKKLESLLSGGYVVQRVEEDLTYQDLLSSEENLWSMLYLTGYLTRIREDEIRTLLPEGCFALGIPNREIKEIFETTISRWFQESTPKWDRRALFDAVWSGDYRTVTKEMTKLLRRTISYHDYREDFYHDFFAGIFVGAGYAVESNREHGEGRSDVIVQDYPGDRIAIFEVKYAKSQESMEKSCEEAVAQITAGCMGRNFRMTFRKYCIMEFLFTKSGVWCGAERVSRQIYRPSEGKAEVGVLWVHQ